MSYARILGGTAAVSGGFYAYYRFRDSGQQVCKLHNVVFTCTQLYINFTVTEKFSVSGATEYLTLPAMFGLAAV